jgi:C-terminal processing protease CtpA/Prc
VSRSVNTEVRQYVDSALDLMQAHSVMRRSVDWSTVRASTLEATASAQSTIDTHAQLRRALILIGDHHGFLAEAPTAKDWRTRPVEHERVPYVGKRPKHIGYVALPQFLSMNKEAGIAYATDLQKHMIEIDRAEAGVCGWIVDLRENHGGNMYPMLAGLGLLLSDGVFGHFIDPDGKVQSWSYRDGAVWIDDSRTDFASANPQSLTHPDAAVAVLVGPDTASAGEVVAIVFSGRPSTRSFGQPTAGLTTANTGYPLSDGAMLYLATASESDRNGRVFEGAITPDEPIHVDTIEGVDMKQAQGKAEANAAFNWLVKQPACATDR